MSTRKERSARNRLAHAVERATVLGKTIIDPLDEVPMAPPRPTLAPIPWNKLTLAPDQRQAISRALLAHYPRSEIAKALGTTIKTLARIIKDDPELTDAADAAKEQEETELRDLLMGMARNGDTVAALFLLKSRHGYVDRPDPKAKLDGFQGGVLVVPGTVPLDEWEAAAARQQAQYRTRDPSSFP